MHWQELILPAILPFNKNVKPMAVIFSKYQSNPGVIYNTNTVLVKILNYLMNIFSSIPILKTLSVSCHFLINGAKSRERVRGVVGGS